MSPRFDSPAPASPDPFSRPRPRAPRSPGHTAQVRVRNRRREYLVRNPLYFKSSEHEFADPLLYDSLIRRFQTPAEREEEGRGKGYARVLEGSLMRGEERLAKLAAEAAAPETFSSSGMDVSSNNASRAHDAVPEPPFKDDSVGLGEPAQPAKSREAGLEQWVDFLRERFIRGGDEDFEYAAVDNDDEYDVLERMEKEEAWFEDEQPEWASESDGGGDDDERDAKAEAKDRRRAERMLEGETGIQDF